MNCSSGRSLEQFRADQPSILVYLGWNCEEECKYKCQWDTIHFLTSNEVGFSENEIPQFHGKWTFIRIFGAQEPASALFSLFNLISTYIAWSRYRDGLNGSPNHRRDTKVQFKPTEDPYFYVTTISAILAINAWLWSTIFHAHDFPVTEKLDYFSAFSVVLYSLFAIVVRLIEEQAKPDTLKTSRLVVHVTIAIPFVAYFAYHVHYLTYKKFDYGYNMKVNLIAGVGGSLLWVYWSLRRYYLTYATGSYIKSSHVWKGLTCIVALNAFLSLELLDFAPIHYIFDAHSLWHAATIGIPFYWFEFLRNEASLNGFKIFNYSQQLETTKVKSN
ncbi:Post-GPI attachment to proteins factor 3 [Halotydeus destructor]|nr:Post-GPI attachment to proteins factor 3 [Halotydeus destructor]